jgi:type II secretory pathway pseudopilin PulG
VVASPRGDEEGRVQIAAFGPTTGWAGRSITYDDGRFALQDHGPISAQDVLEYDRQGQIDWAYDGLREWVQAVATAGVAVSSAAPTAVAAPAHARTPKPAWAIVLIVVGALVTIGGCAAIVVPTFSSQQSKAKESSVEEGIHSIQIAVQSYAVDNGDVYPDQDLVSASGLASYAGSWPTNPYTGEPMAQGFKPGDFTYAVGPGGAWFRLVGYGEDGREVISVGM